MTIQSDPVPSDRCEKCGRYEKSSIEQCFIGDRDCPRVRTLAPTRETAPALSDRVLVRAILENATAFKWSLQGMGMLRLHLSDNTRLHVWDSRYRVPNVSMVHDHLQWGLESTIIAGHLRNHRYIEDARGEPYKFATLKPGYGCFFKHEPVDASLIALPPDIYEEGQSYRQQPSEIHETDALDGTVTLMRKTPTNDESARVFWAIGDEWVSAEPRPATDLEVEDITSFALSEWFGAIKADREQRPAADDLEDECYPPFPHDDVSHAVYALTHDEGEEDALTILRHLGSQLEARFPGKTVWDLMDMAEQRPAAPYKHVDDKTEDPSLLWAEIIHLRDRMQGPDGFATWQDAAEHERIEKMRLKRQLAERPAALSEAVLAAMVTGDLIVPMFGFDLKANDGELLYADRERAITGEPVAPKAWGYHTWDWDAGKYALRGIVKPLPNCGACPGDGSICTASCRLADESPPIDRAAPITGETSRDVREMEARKDAAYLERNQVVAALAKAFPSGIARTAIEGWSEDWHGCVYIDLPTGQASWHFHDSQAYLFDGLPPYKGSWDGHTTEEKYERLSALRAACEGAGSIPREFPDNLALNTSLSGDALIALFRDNGIPMSEANQRLFDVIDRSFSEAGSIPSEAVEREAFERWYAELRGSEITIDNSVEWLAWKARAALAASDESLSRQSSEAAESHRSTRNTQGGKS